MKRKKKKQVQGTTIVKFDYELMDYTVKQALLKVFVSGVLK